MTLVGRPFYDARPDPAGGTAAWTLDDLCEFAASAGDPYGGRLAGGLFDSAADRTGDGRRGCPESRVPRGSDGSDRPGGERSPRNPHVAQVSR